jgi:hypothetical protein
MFKFTVFLGFLLIAGIAEATPTQFQFCAQFKLTCEKPPGKENVDPGQTHCLGNRGSNQISEIIYCTYFQCDSLGNIKMDTTHQMYNPPNGPNRAHNMGHIHYEDSDCWANCCYDHAGDFLGTYNDDKSCQNLCCDTLEGYLAGDCSKGKKAVKTPEPKATPVDVFPTPQPKKTPQVDPTPADGIVESIPDMLIQ